MNPIRHFASPEIESSQPVFDSAPKREADMESVVTLRQPQETIVCQRHSIVGPKDEEGMVTLWHNNDEYSVVPWRRVVEIRRKLTQD